MRDLIALHTSDLGGAEACSEAEKSVVRRVATLTIEMERMEHVFAQIPQETCPSMEMLCVYSRLANTLRRLLDMTGLQRRSRDVTPTIDEYLQSHARDDEDEEDAR